MGVIFVTALKMTVETMTVWLVTRAQARDIAPVPGCLENMERKSHGTPFYYSEVSIF